MLDLNLLVFVLQLVVKSTHFPQQILGNIIVAAKTRDSTTNKEFGTIFSKAAEDNDKEMLEKR